MTYNEGHIFYLSQKSLSIFLYHILDNFWSRNGPDKMNEIEDPLLKVYRCYRISNGTLVFICVVKGCQRNYDKYVRSFLV